MGEILKFTEKGGGKGEAFSGIKKLSCDKGLSFVIKFFIVTFDKAVSLCFSEHVPKVVNITTPHRLHLFQTSVKNKNSATLSFPVGSMLKPSSINFPGNFNLLIKLS